MAPGFGQLLTTHLACVEKSRSRQESPEVCANVWTPAFLNGVARASRIGFIVESHLARMLARALGGFRAASPARIPHRWPVQVEAHVRHAVGREWKQGHRTLVIEPQSFCTAHHRTAGRCTSRHSLQLVHRCQWLVLPHQCSAMWLVQQATPVLVCVVPTTEFRATPPRPRRRLQSIWCGWRASRAGSRAMILLLCPTHDASPRQHLQLRPPPQRDHLRRRIGKERGVRTLAHLIWSQTHPQPAGAWSAGSTTM